jgi:hypothetical protein
MSDLELTVGGNVVATYVDGSEVTDPTLSPRPFLHPVRTLGGTVVTDREPEDHRWHLGISVAIQDVGGANFWGGRTYVREHGYVWRNDHGTQRHRRWLERTADRCREELGWYAADGRQLLAEIRSFGATDNGAGTAAGTSASAGERGWTLSIGFDLRNMSGEPLTLGSPATNGRTGAGYGGLFWRLPRSTTTPLVFTSVARGEADVHGSVAPWLAWVGDAGDSGAPFTVVLAQPDEAHHDPWFVRVEGYPGVCSALAFDQPLVLETGGGLSRRFQAIVVDGALDAVEIADLLEQVI